MTLFEKVGQDAIIGVAVQRDSKVEDPSEADLYPIGTLARVRRVTRDNAGWVRVVLEGLDRFQLRRLSESEPFWRAEGERIEDTRGNDENAKMLAQALVQRVRDSGAGGEAVSNALTEAAAEEFPGRIADLVAASLGLPPEKELEVLEATDAVERLKLVTKFFTEAQEANRLRSKINDDVRKSVGKTQREAILREQMRAIKKELGEDGDDEFTELKKRLDEAGLPEKAREQVDRELKRLEGMNEMQVERGVIRSYLELIAALPWSKRVDPTFDIAQATAKLDADHYGLDDVKKRILEHLAVLKMSKSKRGTILCLAGPPGVGKTSLGQSIADATGRPFVRVSLGGVRDEAEIRGHRRTYVGALPGRILNAMKNVKAKNPVFLLDEIDKLTQGWSGSPEAALLEVLDPEQNGTFQDHYLELPFDLSEVLFICTANSLETISAPLRDRLEIIEVTGYTLDEKFHIARKHLIPKQLEEHGLSDGLLSIDDEALRSMVADYTREAGVRQLSRQFTKLCRGLTLEIAKQPEHKPQPVTVRIGDLNKYLGKQRYFNDAAERTQVPGVATGMAWTPVGGDILFIETTRMPGKGNLEITGQLGDVMKESARAALSFIRGNAAKLGIDPNFLDKQDIHIHVPAGGVPKDGPSAGVTMFTALSSLLSGRRVRHDTAMTGECTLRGRVLPVGGIKEKVLAAHRAGLKRIILPKRNERDLDDVPKEVRAEIEFFFAEDMSQVLDAALLPLEQPTAEVPSPALPL